MAERRRNGPGVAGGEGVLRGYRYKNVIAPGPSNGQGGTVNGRLK